MDIHTDRHQITRLEIVDTGRRRRWSQEAKLRIVEESLAGSRQASTTARRHGISNTLLFAWRKAYREGRLGEVCGFVPTTIAPERPEVGPALPASRIEIVCTNRRRVILGHDVDVEILLRIIRGLETLA
jgi:transposase